MPVVADEQSGAVVDLVALADMLRDGLPREQAAALGRVLVYRFGEAVDQDLHEARTERDEARKELASIRDIACLHLNYTAEVAASKSTAEMVLEMARQWAATGNRGFRDSEHWRRSSEAAQLERDQLRANLDVAVSAIGGLRQILAGIDRYNADVSEGELCKSVVDSDG